MQTMIYDVIIIGSGVSGIFCAYSLINRDENLKILMIDKGPALEKRKCPIESGNIGSCLNCTICQRLSGFAGLGKSEGKFNFSLQFGGRLQDKIGEQKVEQLLNKVDQILVEFGGGPAKTYSTFNSNFLKQCISEGVEAQFSDVRHLGNAISTTVFKNLYTYLTGKVDFSFGTNIIKVSKQENFCVQSDNKTFYSQKLIIASGSNSQDLTKSLANKFCIQTEKTRVDLGIRIEASVKEFESLLEEVPEFKMKYLSGSLGAYTYCMNPYGYVIKKHQNGFVFADGQNFRERGVKSPNINFTIFFPKYFDTLDQSDNYIFEIASKINAASEQLIVQRLSDLRLNRSTTEKQISCNTISPTVDAKGGNLNAFLPGDVLSGTLELLRIIERLIGTKLTQDTLLYGIDIKTYAPILKTDNRFHSSVSGLYFIGDCSGETWSLSYAAASGLYLGNQIAEKA